MAMQMPIQSRHIHGDHTIPKHLNENSYTHSRAPHTSICTHVYTFQIKYTRWLKDQSAWGKT